MEQSAKVTAPYLPFKTFLSGVEVLQVGLPPTLDKSVWPTMSGMAKSSLMSAFKFLNLIDENGNVQPALSRLVTDPGNRKATLAEIITSSYPEVIALARANGTSTNLQAAMAKIGGSSETTKKAITFFLKASEYADLPLSPQWKKLSRTSPSSAAKKRRPTNAKGGKNGAEPSEAVPPKRQPHQEQPAGDSRTVNLHGGGVVTLTVSVPLIGLTQADRNWLFDVIDKFNAYNAGPAQADGLTTAS